MVKLRQVIEQYGPCYYFSKLGRSCV